MVRPRSRKLAPASSMPRVPRERYAQWVEEWSGLGDQGVVRPRSSDLGKQTAKLGHERWIPDNTPVTSREKPRSRGSHACGVDDAFRHNISKEPLEEIKSERVTFQG